MPNWNTGYRNNTLIQKYCIEDETYMLRGRRFIRGESFIRGASFIQFYSTVPTIVAPTRWARTTPRVNEVGINANARRRTIIVKLWKEKRATGTRLYKPNSK